LSFFEHEFESPLERYGVGRERKVWYHVVFLPNEMATQLSFGKGKRLRVEGEINEVPIENAFVSDGTGRFYLIVNPRVIKAAALTLGQPLTMRFRVAQNKQPDLPDPLKDALRRHPQASEQWRALTPGKQRGLAYFVAAVASADAQERRCRAIIEALGQGEGSPADASALRQVRQVLGARRVKTG
jgi:hypothetical protein